MPSFIIKPRQDEDFYVRYSTIVDAPTHWGTREQLVGLPHAFGPETFAEERFARADDTGTSALWPEDGPYAYGWEDPDRRIQVRECVVDPTEPDEEATYGTIAVDDLRAFCETVGADEQFHPPAGMVTWESTGEEQQR